MPRLLTLVSNEGSKELFTLAVLAIAIGFAFLSSTVFGVSFALGAFLAGAVVGESDLSHQAAADALPLRDAFAVLFFVSVGMLLDPSVLIDMPLAIAAVVVLVVFGKAIDEVRDRRLVRLSGPGRPDGRRRSGPDRRVLVHPRARSACRSGCSRPRGSSSSSPGRCCRSRSTRSCSASSIRSRRRLRDDRRMTRLLEWRAGDLAHLEPTEDEAPLRLHAILCGYGQVGRLIGRALDRRGFTYVVISQQRTEVEGLRARGVHALFGEASNIELLERAHVEHARLVIVASSDPQVSPLIVERAKALNPAWTSWSGRRATRRPPRSGRSARRSRPSTPNASWRSRWRATRCAVRAQRGRGRGDRPGPARTGAGRGPAGRPVALDPAARSRGRSHGHVTGTRDQPD